jgi:dipeptidase
MCDSLVATGSHTRSGATLFAKNSDRSLGECQPLLQFPAAVHPRGAKLRCTHIEIPQVAETYRVMGHSPWWVWGFEHGVNEHGIAIGNQTVFSNEPVEEAAGLIGMDLVRLGLERGRDAREALEAIASLLESYGQGGPAFAPEAAGYHNSFMIAGPEEAWVMETTGRRWAARQVELDALTNHITIGSNWGIGSRDLESFARREGWWQDKGRVNVSKCYRNRAVPGWISEGRLRRSRELLAAGSGALDGTYLQRALRDHLDGGPAPPAGATPEDERYFTLCMHSEPVGTTTASLVASLPKDRLTPWPVWVSFASPCTGIFLPVYLDGVIPASLSRGGASAAADSAWWAFHELQQAASTDFARFTPLLRREWWNLEEKIDLERRAVESSARLAAVSGDDDEVGRVLTEFMARSAAEAIARAVELKDLVSG